MIDQNFKEGIIIFLVLLGAAAFTGFLLGFAVGHVV